MPTRSGQRPRRTMPADHDAPILAFAAGTYALLLPLLSLQGQISGPREHAAMGIELAWSLVLLAWCRLGPRSFSRWRHWLVGLYQLSPVVLLLGGVHLQLSGPATPGLLGAVGDAVRVLTGGPRVQLGCSGSERKRSGEGSSCSEA